MNDLIPDGGITPTPVLAKLGVSAVGFLAGGVGLFVLGILPAPMGIVAGGLAAVLGIGALLSRDPDDRKGGIIIIAAGIVSILARLPLSRVVAAPVMRIAALGFIVYGVWKGIQFFKGLKTRR
ncbi:MAG: hypothetical protein LBQ35_00410 [Spirochaetaceae bacterium]|nr:hypothetical protein [Spirochaetaceae bacterium]